MQLKFAALKFSRLRQLRWQHYAVFIFLIINLAGLIVFLATHITPKPNPIIEQNFNQVTQHLTAIENQLKGYQAVSQKQQEFQQQQFYTLHEQLNKLEKAYKNTPSYQQALQLIESQQQTLLSKLNQLAAKEASLRLHKNTSLISTKQLPFKVLGIDIWNGAPKVTVSLKNERNLLALHDSLAGWILTDVNADTGTAVFQNAKYQQIKLTL